MPLKLVMLLFSTLEEVNIFKSHVTVNVTFKVYRNLATHICGFAKTLFSIEVLKKKTYLLVFRHSFDQLYAHAHLIKQYYIL